MSDQQAYERVLPKLKAFTPKEVHKPDMPIEQAIKEGGIMAAAAVEDTAAFTGIKVPAELITELGDSVAAVRYTQAQYTASIGALNEAGKQWADEEPKAIALRTEFYSAYDYGLRNVPNAVRAISAIRKGTGAADLLKDLSALIALGRTYKQQLIDMNYDLSILDTAEAKVEELNKIYVKAFIEKTTADASDLRYRAFTYMRINMGEILDAAEHIFRNNPQRLALYHSAYRSRRRKNNTDPESTTPSSTPPAPETPTK